MLRLRGPFPAKTCRTLGCPASCTRELLKQAPHWKPTKTGASAGRRLRIPEDVTSTLSPGSYAIAVMRATVQPINTHLLSGMVLFQIPNLKFCLVPRTGTSTCGTMLKITQHGVAVELQQDHDKPCMRSYYRICRLKRRARC